MSRAVVRDSRPRVGSPSPSWSPDILSTTEMEAVTTVFRNFETGLREASIDTKVKLFRENLEIIRKKRTFKSLHCRKIGNVEGTIYANLGTI